MRSLDWRDGTDVHEVNTESGRKAVEKRNEENHWVNVSVPASLNEMVYIPPSAMPLSAHRVASFPAASRMLEAICQSRFHHNQVKSRTCLRRPVTFVRNEQHSPLLEYSQYIQMQ